MKGHNRVPVVLLSINEKNCKEIMQEDETRVGIIARFISVTLIPRKETGTLGGKGSLYSSMSLYNEMQ
jgi:hypothetical protein